MKKCFWYKGDLQAIELIVSNWKGLYVMSKIKWIHFSDLHLNQTGTETNRLRNKLIDYLSELNLKCDYAFCTGDIRYAPDGYFLDKSYEQIENICKAVQLPKGRLFIVPGNHDIKRDEPERNSAIELIMNGNSDRKPYDTTIGKISSDDLNAISKGKKEFSEFLDTFYGEYIDVLKAKEIVKSHYVVETEDINIIHVDSTLTYNKDRQKDFILGSFLIQGLLEKLNKSKVSILLTHYSFDFLERNEQKELVTLFNDYNIRLWLAGHEHDHLAREQWDSFFEFQSGNLVLEAGATACVLIGEMDTDTGKGEIKVHAWYPQGGWNIYPFVSQVGKDKSVYQFDIKKFNTVEVDKRIDIQRCKELRLEILNLLEENRVVFETYGPTNTNRSNILSEYADSWHILVRKTILPNSIRIIEMLQQNISLLNEQEREVFYRYKQHIAGFEKNHGANNKFVMDAPRFPKEIYGILKRED